MLKPPLYYYFSILNQRTKIGLKVPQFLYLIANKAFLRFFNYFKKQT